MQTKVKPCLGTILRAISRYGGKRFGREEHQYLAVFGNLADAHAFGYYLGRSGYQYFVVPGLTGNFLVKFCE